jgi:hypothetical protein
VADKSVLKIVGTLYDIERPKSMFGKELPTRYNKIGSFVGRRRVVLQEEEEEEEDYSDDDEEEYSSGDGKEEGNAHEDEPREQDAQVDLEEVQYDGDPYYGESRDGEEYDD